MTGHPVQGLRRIREAASLGYDLDAIAADLQARERASGRRTVQRPARRPVGGEAT